MLGDKNIYKYLNDRKQLKYKEYNINDKKYNKELNTFVKTMENNFDKEELSTMSNNIETLKIKVKNLKIYNIINQGIVCGSYFSNSNKIIINKDIPINNVIYHELFHMASTIKNIKCYNIGFSIKNSLYKFGEKLNEGYTDIMANRYFISPISYKIEAIIVNQIEKVVGKDKMEKLYLHSDLKGLIESLKKYTSENEIINFIYAFDKYTKYYSKKNNREARLVVNNIVGYLYILHRNYINKRLDSNEITSKMYISYITKVKSDLIKILDIFYEILNIKNIDNEFSELNLIKSKKY